MPFRNVESHFSRIPDIKVERSKMPVNKKVLTSFNSAELVPFYVREVLPGDTFKIDYDAIVRQTTSLHPTMDNLYVDTFFFYVPNRLCFEHWKNLMGESDKAWIDPDNSDIEMPHITFSGDTNDLSSNTEVNINDRKSLLSYLGLPPFNQQMLKGGSKFSLAPLSAYIEIWNQFFRDENYVDCCPNLIKHDDDFDHPWAGFANGSIGNSLVDFYRENFDSNFSESKFVGSMPCFKAARFHDYFSSALPQPQKGGDVLVPLLSPSPVEPLLNSDGEFATNDYQVMLDSQGQPIKDMDFESADSSDLTSLSDGTLINRVGVDTAEKAYLDPNGTLGIKSLNTTINALRLAFQTQRLLERDALSGTRYIELLKAHFGVTSSDSRLQRPEYLGGDRHLINVSEVLQNAPSNGDDNSLGSLGGRLVSHIGANCVRKSFEEHGWLIGLLTVRSDRTYGQGIQKQFQRSKRLDYFFPVLAHIGEQPIMQSEIYAYVPSASQQDDFVFGYQEAWADYRYDVNELRGEFNPGADGNNSLLSWTYGDFYSSDPFISPEWLYNNEVEVDRTLAIKGKLASQFIADIYIHGDMVRPMPVYSVPGLIDHF